MQIQISSGKGPKECELAVEKFYDVLKREYPMIEMVSAAAGQDGLGYTSLQLRSKADLSHLEGSVLWICKSPYRPDHKRKNWYLDVSVVPAQMTTERSGELQIDTFRSSGKGGQHVNKVETGIRITHLATGLTVTSTTARSQYQNRQLALKRLDELFAMREHKQQSEQKNLAWLERNRIIRGNPIRIYEGLDFKRKKI